MDIESDIQSSCESLISSSKEDYKSPESSDCEGYATPLATSRSDLISIAFPESSEAEKSGELTPVGSSRAVSPIVVSTVLLAPKETFLSMTTTDAIATKLLPDDEIAINHDGSAESYFDADNETEDEETKSVFSNNLAPQTVEPPVSSEPVDDALNKDNDNLPVSRKDQTENMEIQSMSSSEIQQGKMEVQNESEDDESKSHISNNSAPQTVELPVSSEPKDADDAMNKDSDSLSESSEDQTGNIDEIDTEGQEEIQCVSSLETQQNKMDVQNETEDEETKSDFSNNLASQTAELPVISESKDFGDHLPVSSDDQTENTYEIDTEGREIQCISSLETQQDKMEIPNESEDEEETSEVVNILDEIINNAVKKIEDGNYNKMKDVEKIVENDQQITEQPTNFTYLETKSSESDNIDMQDSEKISISKQLEEEEDSTSSNISSQEDELEVSMEFGSENESDNSLESNQSANLYCTSPLLSGTRTVMLEKYPLSETEDASTIPPSNPEKSFFEDDSQQISAEFEELVAAINAFGQQGVAIEEEEEDETISTLKNGDSKIVVVNEERKGIKEGAGRREEDSVAKCFNDQISQTEHDSRILVDYNIPQVMEAVKSENKRLQMQLDHIQTDEIEVLNSTIADLQRQLNEANQTIDEIEVEAEQQYTEMTSEIDELCELVMKKDEEISSLKEKVGNLSVSQNQYKEDVDSQKAISQRQKEIIEGLREEIESTTKKLDEMTKLRDKAVEEATINKMRNQEKERFLAKEAQMSMEIDDLQRELNKQKLILNQTSMAKLADTFERKVLKLENDIRERDMLICRQNQIINGSRKMPSTSADGKKLISSRTAALAADNLPSAGSSSESFQNGLDQDAKYTILSFLLSDRHSQLANIYNIGRILELNNQEERTLERHLTRENRFT